MSVAEEILPKERVDKRAWPRVCVYIGIDVYSDHNFYTGFSLNLSEGGVFVATHNIVPMGTSVIIHMTLPFDPVPVVTLAEVRWARDFTDGSDVPPGLGLQFVEIDEEGLRRVTAFVTTVREPLFFEA